MTHLIEVTPNEYDGMKDNIMIPDKTTLATGDNLIVSMVGYRIQKEYKIEDIFARSLGWCIVDISPLRDDLPSSVGGGFNDGEGEE